MTAETSNARGDAYTFDMIEEAWGDAVPLTKPYFDRFRARLETLRQSAAPPPADAEARVYQCPRCATSMEVDPTAKPEARGVVDEAMVERAYRAWREAAVAREGNRPAIRAALTAALTEARNVR